MVAGDPEASRHVQATHVRSNSRTLQSPPVRRTSPDQRSLLRETQALSPAEFNADRPVATVTRHVNDARQPVNRAALERLVIGTVLDQSLDAGISPAEPALNLRSARCPRAPVNATQKSSDATGYFAAPTLCRSRHKPPTFPTSTLGKVSKIERFRCSTRQRRQNERHATGR